MKKEDLHKYNAEYFWHPMAHPGDMKKNKPIVISRGEGVDVEDIDGHRVLDGVGGLWCVNLGYSNQAVKDAIARQLEALPFYNCFRGTSNNVAVELSTILVDFFREEGMSRVFYTSGGSDSVETALRLARQYHKVAGAPQRSKFIGLRNGYHGTNFGGSSVNGITRFHRQYEPMLAGCYHIPCPWPYRNPWDETDPAALADLCANALEAEIQFQGPDTIAAFVMEPVLGSGGVIVPHASFMPKVREICDRHGILLIADEIITGFGRAGDWSGSRLWGTRPDLMTLAKGISNGYIPFGAVMIGEQVAEAIEASPSAEGTLSTGYTYSGHPVGAAAAIAAISESRRLDIAGNAAKVGLKLKEDLSRLQEKHPIVGDVRGQGLMLALELVADRVTKSPLDGKSVQAIFQATYKAGAMVRVSGNLLIISPPLIINEEQAGVLARCIDEGLAAHG